jgi:Ran GTPase-activating protein (RanGAP) involved in mRNA processing and transport
MNNKLKQKLETKNDQSHKVEILNLFEIGQVTELTLGGPGMNTEQYRYYQSDCVILKK